MRRWLSPSNYPSFTTLSLSRVVEGGGAYPGCLQGLRVANLPVPQLTQAVSHPFLFAAGCCGWGWAASGLCTSGTAGASGVWCCSQTGPSWQCQSAARTGRGSNLQKKPDRMSKHKTSFLQRSYMGRKWWHSKKNKNKKWPPRASGETRDSVCGLRGFQDVLWFVATVFELRVTTWTLIFPPDGSHASFLPRMAFETLMYKPVSSKYSPTDEGRSRDIRLQPVTWSLTITCSFVVWHVFDNTLQ